MTRASVITGIGRTDRLEYPIEVIRELVVNALLHRDYSPGARGSQVQIELYPDRLVVRSPGGFYGTVDPSNFGDPDVSSSRNALLARILADTPTPDGRHMVAENRGSGIPTVLRTLHAAGMAPPEFLGDFRRVEVTVPHNALLTPEVLDWVRGLGQEGLSQAQVQALALLRAGTQVRNQTLRGWGLHPADATRELADLVRRGLATKVGDRRGASYQLRSATDHGQPSVPQLPLDLSDRQARILELVRKSGQVSSAQLVEALDIPYGTLINDVNALIAMGRLVPTAPARSRKRAYRLTERAVARD